MMIGVDVRVRSQALFFSSGGGGLPPSGAGGVDVIADDMGFPLVADRS
jgi:hypothetical protein